MSSRHKTYVLAVTFNGLTLFLLLMLTLGTGAPSSSRSTLLVPTPPRTPALERCPSLSSGVVLFSRQTVRCVASDPHAGPNEDWTQQRLSSTLDQVFMLCAFGETATVVYQSSQDQQPPSGVFGDIEVFLQQDTCQTVQNAIGEPSMAVTSIMFRPFYGGRGDGPPPHWLIHQTPSDQCASRSDFFTIWYHAGKALVCYANAGTLQLVQPLSGVVKVCSGNNSGEVFWSPVPFTVLSLDLEGGQCATTTQSLREASISVNVLAIEPIEPQKGDNQ